MVLPKFRGSAADRGGLIIPELPFKKRLKGELSEQRLRLALTTVGPFAIVLL